MPKIEENVETLIMPIIEKLGYSLYDVQYVKEGKDYYLRVFIDKEEGISLDDCEKVNNAITDILDEKNYIKDQYFLEISSPGIERILRKDKHLNDNIGNKICINLFKPIEKEKQIIGTLEKFDDNSIYVNCKDTIQIDRKNISLIKTVYDWN
jgi:ribosome maturation factor RimP